MAEEESHLYDVWQQCDDIHLPHKLY